MGIGMPGQLSGDVGMASDLPAELVNYTVPDLPSNNSLNSALFAGDAKSMKVRSKADRSRFFEISNVPIKLPMASRS